MQGDDKLQKLLILKRFLPVIIPCVSIFFIIIIVLMVCTSSSGDSTVLAGTFFRKPFKDDVNYIITSEFGNRKDPFNEEVIKFHTGIDLSAPDGTAILSIGDGIVTETGNNPAGFGNYVYIKHNYKDKVYYSIYGHLLDKSIRVSEEQRVKAGDVIGIIGTTGNSTGVHLHLTLMSPIFSFESKYLVDPKYVIEGL